MTDPERPTVNHHSSEPDPCDGIPGLAPEGGLKLPQPPRHVPSPPCDDDRDGYWSGRNGYGQHKL